MRKKQKGQALVIVLLSLAVVLTLVLFILSRSITDISVTSSNEQSVRAFSAAEAGIEQALVVGTGTSQTVGGATFTSSVSNFAQGQTSFIYPLEINSGDTTTLWLKSQDASPDYAGSSVKVCWGKPGTYSDPSKIPAIEVTVFYETSANDPSTVKLFRAAYDSSSRNSFSAAGGPCTISGQGFAYSSVISLAGLSNPQFIRFRMFYNSDTTQTIGFDSTDAHTFPTQGQDIISTGTSGANNNSSNLSTRRLDVFQGWPEASAIFENSIYSPSGLSQ